MSSALECPVCRANFIIENRAHERAVRKQLEWETIDREEKKIRKALSVAQAVQKENSEIIKPDTSDYDRQLADLSAQKHANRLEFRNAVQEMIINRPQ